MCGSCEKEKHEASFYSPGHKDCRVCTKKARLLIGAPLELQALQHRISKLTKKEEKSLAHKNAVQRKAAARNRKREHVAASALDQELASRTLARRRLLPFVQRFHGKYKAGWVHHDICRRLEKFSREVAEGKSPRLLLLMPPRAGKSEIASRKFPAWHLGQYPDHEFIAASNSASLALGFSRHIREILRDPAYQSVFPEARLDPDSQSIEQWATTKGGSYTAAGIGTGIVGKGAHVLVIDDPVRDMEQADSVAARDATWDWYMAAALTRLAPGGGVLGILTWWNDDDWAGRIQAAMETGDGEKFVVVKYPAINEGYDEYLSRDDEILKVKPGEESPEGARLLRVANSALHPERYTFEYLTRLKKNYFANGNGRIWSALYQQNPAPDEGVFFTKDMMRYYSTAPDRKGRYVYQAWDFAITEKKENDWNVCSTMLQDERNAVYELDLARFKTDNSFVIADSILDQWEKHRPDMLGFEDGQIWKSVKAVFEKRCEERKLFPAYEVLTPFTDKKVRANPLKGRMQLGKVYFSSEAHYRHDADQEMLRFPAGKHDDIVDARAWCVRLMLTKTAPRMPEPKPLKSWKDKLRAMGKTGLSHMAA